MATLLVAACSPSKPTPPPNTGGGSAPLTATAVNINEDLTVFVPMLNNPFPLIAHGGTPPYTYSHTGTLPAGLSYNPSTGEVSGTPSTASTPVTIVYSVRDATGKVAETTATVVYTVHPAPTFTISGKITGGVQGGVVVVLSPSDGTAATTLADGTYSLSGVMSGVYTATPTLAGTTFTPASRQVTVNGANVTGVNFTTPLPELKVGKLLYPSFSAIRSKDLSTGEESVLYGSTLISIETIVPYRSEPKIAFIGSNVGLQAVLVPSLAPLGRVQLSGWTMAPTNCWAWPADYPDSSFDIGSIAVSETGPLMDFVAIASRCTEPGFPEKTDIFLVLMDGLGSFARVTNDDASDSEPIISAVDPVTGQVTILWIRNNTEIRKQIINPANDLLVGTQTIVASNVMKGRRTHSANVSGTHLAYMKNVGGVSHIVVLPLAGGAEVDLGNGTDPYWSRDGSNLILLTDQNALWAIKPDGTGKMSVPTPGNLVPNALNGGLSKVVFGPPGF